jgi:hypothetical protein
LHLCKVRHLSGTREAIVTFPSCLSLRTASPRRPVPRVRYFSAAAEAIAVQASKAAQPALFSETVASQVTDFLKHGFVLIRMPKKNELNAQYNVEAVKRVHKDIQTNFTDTFESWDYKFWRMFHSVNSPALRHSIALPMTLSLRSLLDGAISYIRPFLDSQLPNKNSPLVELSAVLSLPGATAQAVHTDILFPRCDVSSDQTLILTAMLALQDISLQNGPTFVYSGSHAKEFHKRHRRHVQSGDDAHYDSYGDIVHEGYLGHGENDITDGRVDEEEDEDENYVPPVPFYAELKCGDLLLFDAKLFHFGGANASEHSRDLLSWSFQKPAYAAFYTQEQSPIINGFTYHIKKELKSALVLQDFQPKQR